MGRYPPGMDPVSALAPALQIVGQRLEHLAGRVDEAIDGQHDMKRTLSGLETRMGDLEERERERNGSIKDMMEWRKTVEQDWHDRQTVRVAETALRKRYFTNVRLVVGHDLTKFAILGVIAVVGGGIVGDVLQKVWGL